MPTCLFTERPLSADTSLEHAPPRAMGGRFASNTSTHDEFNHRAGESIDKALQMCWVMAINEMQALMPASHRSDLRLRIRDGERDLEYGPGGTLTELPWVEKDEHGTVQKIASPNRAYLRRVARGTPHLAGKPLLARAPANSIVNTSMSWQNLDSEYACLKTILVVFDIANSCSADAWVRSPMTADARALVRDRVVGDAPDVQRLSPAFQGIDYGIRESILHASTRAGHSPRPHEHIFIACGDPARRTITGTWLIYGVEPISFLLSTEYRSDVPFTQIAGCGPLRDQAAWWTDPMESLAFTLSKRGCSTAVASNQRQEDIVRMAELSRIERLRLIGEVRGLAGLEADDQRPEYMRNFVLSLHERGEELPATVGELVERRLAMIWPAGKVGKILCAEAQAADSAGEPLHITLPIAMGFIPPWAVRAADAYAISYRLLHAALGPPRVSVEGSMRIEFGGVQRS